MNRHNCEHGRWQMSEVGRHYFQRRLSEGVRVVRHNDQHGRLEGSEDGRA